jgi:hypothetical protein
MPAIPLQDRPALASSGQRLRIAVLAAIVLSPALAFAAPATTADAATPTAAAQASFMWALGRRESGGNYRARNRYSGAYGKYQIMPSNWPSWAGQFLGNRRARQTPVNQERVARGKVRNLYRWLGSWRRVAYWWLTGSNQRYESRWSPTARRYVNDIMRLQVRAPRNAGRAFVTKRIQRRSNWRVASSDLRLRFAPAGRKWARQGRIDAGSVVRVRSVKRLGQRRVWLRVVTRNGRIGWVNRYRTLPTRKPARAVRWADVRMARPR